MAKTSAILAITSANKEIKNNNNGTPFGTTYIKSGITNSHKKGNNICQYKHRLKHQPNGNNITICHNKATWQ